MERELLDLERDWYYSLSRLELELEKDLVRTQHSMKNMMKSKKNKLLPPREHQFP
jgi:hypothetical protein